MNATIPERIVETASRLEAMRGERGKAALDGQPFDAEGFAALEAELAALRDAEGVQARRERDVTAKGRAAHKAAQRDRLRELERKRVEALQAAEEAARGLAAAIERALATTAEMSAAAHEISGGVPVPLQSIAFAGRLSNRLCAVMGTVKGHKFRLGNLEWHHSMCQPTESWPVEESRLLEPHLKPIIGETK